MSEYHFIFHPRVKKKCSAGFILIRLKHHMFIVCGAPASLDGAFKQKANHIKFNIKSMRQNIQPNSRVCGRTPAECRVVRTRAGPPGGLHTCSHFRFGWRYEGGRGCWKHLDFTPREGTRMKRKNWILQTDPRLKLRANRQPTYRTDDPATEPASLSV